MNTEATICEVPISKVTELIALTDLNVYERFAVFKADGMTISATYWWHDGFICVTCGEDSWCITTYLSELRSTIFDVMPGWYFCTDSGRTTTPISRKMALEILEHMPERKW